MKKVSGFIVLGFAVFLVMALFFWPAAVPANAEEVEVVQKCPVCGQALKPGEKHVHEEEAALPFSAGADLGFFSKYMWRGLNVTNDPVFQPSVWLTYKGFTVNAWANMDLTNINGLAGNINEVDYTANYSTSFDKVGLSAGVVHYTFPHTSFDSTSEVYGAVSYDTLLAPSLAVYYDFDEADGFYSTLTLSHSFELPKVVEPVSMKLDLSGQVGWASKNWNEFYYGASHSTFTNFLATAALPVAVGKHITIKPSVNYSTTLDKTLSSKAANDHEFIYGVTVSAAF